MAPPYLAKQPTKAGKTAVAHTYSTQLQQLLAQPYARNATSDAMRLPQMPPAPIHDNAPWTATPVSPPASVDFLLLLFVSVFVFITAAAIRLVPWAASVRPRPHPGWALREGAAIHSGIYAGYGAIPGGSDLSGLVRDFTHAGGAPSYESLLEIGDRLGSAKTGFSDEQIRILPTYICRCVDEGASSAGSSVTSGSPDEIGAEYEKCKEHDVHERTVENNDAQNCAICRDRFRNLEKLCILPCGDEFHSDCISPWLRQQATCPLCRCRFA